MNAACGREGTLGCCAREYPLGDEGFVAGKGTTGGPAKDAKRILWGGSLGAAIFMNNGEPIAKLWGDEWQSHFEAIFGVE